MAATRTRGRKADRKKRAASPGFEKWKRQIAGNVRRIRHELEITQMEAAIRCGLDLRQYQCCEYATQNLTIATLAKVSDGLDVEPIELFRTLSE